MTKANDRQVGGEHYRSPIQHWDYVLANDIPYLEAQIIKYITRHKKKNGLQDLAKAHHFLDKLIEVEKGKLTTPTQYGSCTFCNGLGKVAYPNCGPISCPVCVGRGKVPPDPNKLPKSEF